MGLVCFVQLFSLNFVLDSQELGCHVIFVLFVFFQKKVNIINEDDDK